ncbi:MAG: ATP synthase F0 subunit B [Acidobacteria bacterium]|nr:MAG: ATP synthase F0 subunit B [Acidobacteriota bacterium]
MNTLLLAEVDGGGQIQQIASTFGVDWPHLVAQMISFGIVCILLHRFGYKPILRMLGERRQQIAQGLADTEKIKAELDRTEAQRQEIMMQANAQAAKLIEEAHAAAARVQQQESQKAIAAAEQIIIKSREVAVQEHARMLAELKREVGRLVVQATVAVTGKILTPEDQRRMAEESMRELATAA